MDKIIESGFYIYYLYIYYMGGYYCTLLSGSVVSSKSLICSVLTSTPTSLLSPRRVKLVIAFFKSFKHTLLLSPFSLSSQSFICFVSISKLMLLLSPKKTSIASRIFLLQLVPSALLSPASFSSHF